MVAEKVVKNGELWIYFEIQLIGLGLGCKRSNFFNGLPK